MKAEEAKEKTSEEVEEKADEEKIEHKEGEIAEEAKGEEVTEESLEEKLEEAKAEKTLEEAAREEVKPPREEIEKEIVEERFYTIPLSKAWLMPPNKRAPKAIKIIRDFIKRHMKLEARKEGAEEEAEPKKLVISNELNEKVWSRGIEKPPRKIRVRAARDKDGNVTVYLAEGD